MTRIERAVSEYLAVRRKLGFGLRLAGGALRSFAAFLAHHRESRITTSLALAWATSPTTAQPPQWANRLAMVRRFARHHAATDPRTEIPPDGLLPHRYRRVPPYLYSDGEIRKLIAATKRLPSRLGLRSATYATIFGLVAATGMRMSEPIALDRSDVDLARGLVTIRLTKFRKSRLIPVRRSTCAALRDYASRRDRLVHNPKDPSFFISEWGTRLTEWSVRWTFVQMSHRIGLRKPGDSRGPRLHDLRHRFAVQTLLGWYRSGADAQQQLPKLSTYLGHTHVADTYWYISAIPELLKHAARRVDRRERGASS
ncbi:MAG: tyrosine-type recombinase/integrase [Burkholderiales bacterium]